MSNTPIKKKRVKKVKAWAIIMSGYGNSYIPQVGNGSQWQYPIFRTRREAKEFKKEPHGLEDGKVVPCEITYKF